MANVRRRARIYSPFFPYPFTEGSFPVIYDQARTLAEELGWEVELVVWKDSPAEVTRKLRLSTDPFSEAVRITLLGAGGGRTLRASEWMQQPGSPPPASAPVEPAAFRAIRVAASLVSPWASPETFHYPTSLDPGASLGAADLGIYHYSFAYPWLAREQPRPERRVVVHFHNLESDLAHLRRTTAPGGSALDRAIHGLNARKLARHERLLSRHADELWFLSARDLTDFGSADAPTTLRHVPPTFDLRLRDRRLRGPALASEPRVCAGFLGGCYFEPNRASLEWIVDRLAPELERLGFGGRVVVGGRDVPESLRRRAARYGFFEWLGFVPDLESYWSRLSFFLVPHVVGSGVRIKLLEAMVSGVPVLANRAAALPLSPELRDSPLLRIADDPAEWARRIAAEPAPLHSRSAYDQNDRAIQALDGRRVYEFLAEASLPAPGLSGS